MNARKLTMISRIYCVVVSTLMFVAVFVTDKGLHPPEETLAQNFQILFWFSVAIVVISFVYQSYLYYLRKKSGNVDRLLVCGSRIMYFSFGFVFCTMWFSYQTAGSLNVEFLQSFTKLLSFLPVLVMGYVLAVRPKVYYLCSSGKCRKSSVLHSIKYLFFGIATGKNKMITVFALFAALLPMVVSFYPQYVSYCYYVGLIVLGVECILFSLYFYSLYLCSKDAKESLSIIISLVILEGFIVYFYFAMCCSGDVLHSPLVFLLSAFLVLSYFIFGSGFFMEHLKYIRKKARG